MLDRLGLAIALLALVVQGCNHDQRIYVYEVEDSPLLTFDVRSIYSPEQRIYAALLRSSCRTTNQSEAQLFYVPTFGSFVAHRNQLLSNSTSAALLDAYHHHARAHAALLESESSAYYYRRKNGTDHVFTISHDIGSCLAPAYMARSSRFLQVHSEKGSLASAQRVFEYLSISIDNHVEAAELAKRPFQFPCYSPETGDVVVPPFIGERYSLAIDEFLKKEQRQERTMKFHFRGSLLPMPYSYGVRQWLNETGLALPFLSDGTTLSSDDLYWRELTSSTFCFSPPGWFQWSPRTYQAVAAGCIPVLIQNRTTALPFEGNKGIEWSKFSVILDLENFEDELEAFVGGLHPDPDEIKRMQAELRRVWRAFTYSSETSVFAVTTASEGATSAVVETEDGGAMDYILANLFNVKI